MLSIFSCAYWPSVCLWRNVCLDTLSYFSCLGCFLILSCLSCLYILEITLLLVASFANVNDSPILPFCKLSFHFVYGFLFCAKAFKFNQVPFVYFCFYFHYSRRQIQKDIAAIYVKESVLPVILQVLYDISSYILQYLVLYLHLSLFLCIVLRECSNFILSHVVLGFLHCIVFPPLLQFN